MAKPSRILFFLPALMCACGAFAADNPCLSVTSKSLATLKSEGILEKQTTAVSPHTFGGHFLQFAREFVDWKTDLQVVVSPAATAGMSQLLTDHKGFASGPRGFGAHYGVDLIGGLSGRFFSHFLMPAVFHQNASYMRKGAGGRGLAGIGDRLAHVAMHIPFTSSDHGNGLEFNAADLPASLLNAKLSNAYQPDAQRTTSATLEEWGWGVLGYTASDLYGEFAPCFINEKCTKAPPIPSNIHVDFSMLEPDSRQLFSTCCIPSDERQWSDLDPTERLEYAGVAQALHDWSKLDPDRNGTQKQPGLDAVSGVQAVCGSIEGAPSPDQFNLHVAWKADAEKRFSDAKWGTHISWLHPGMHGYQQDVDGDPFLGLVVLFSDKVAGQGQIHIDFLDFPGHYFPSNADISQNYSYYCNWYGQIIAYNGACAATETEQLAFSEPRKPVVPVSASPATPDINAALRQFLIGWYIDHNYSALQTLTAHDNVYAQPVWKTQTTPMATMPSAAAIWQKLFQDASIVSRGNKALAVRPRTLEDVIVRPPVPEAISKASLFSYQTEVQEPFLVLDPKLLPEGSLFPPPNVPKQKFSMRARYLDHIRNTYDTYIVVYVTKGSDLVPETAISYWIKEDGNWKLGMYQGLSLPLSTPDASP